MPLAIGNGLLGSTTGFEFVPNWKPAAWWRLEGSYSYLNMDLKTRPGSTDTTTVRSNQGSSPRHQVGVKSYLDLPGRVEFSQIFRYITALPAQSVASYATADARIAWRPVEHLEFAVSGQNLLQPHHVEYGGNPGTLVGIRRSVFAAMTWRK